MSKMKKMFKLGSKKHADPSEWTKSDDKMLVAIQTDDMERVEQLLVKKGVNPAKINAQGLTALHVAAMEGRLAIIQFFQERGVDLTTLDFFGKAPLHCACKSGHLDLVRYLLQLNPELLTAVDHNDLTPLHHACLSGNLDTSRHLLRVGSSVSARDKVGRTPLFICARLGKLEMCKDILDEGADINHRDLDKMTALMFAVEYQHTEVVEYLVRRGANTLLTDAGGRNAMSYAKQTENEDVIKILENAPSRASWNLDKVEETIIEATVVDEADMVARFEPVEEEAPPEAHTPVAPARKPKQAPPPPPPAQTLTPPPEFDTQQEPSQLEKLEHGIVPLEEAQDFDEYDVTPEVAAQVEVSTYHSTYHSPPARPLEEDDTDTRHFSPEALAAVEAIMQTSESPPPAERQLEELKVDAEAYKELEEEHEYLNRELQQVSVEKKQLQEKVEVLERRLSASDTEAPISPLIAPVQSIIDYTLVESLEEELAEARNQIADDKVKMADLEEDVKQLRKQIHLDSKPEADRSVDDSWNDSDEDLFESEADIKKKSSAGAAEIAVVASLRTQVLDLERELEEAKSQIKEHPAREQSLLSESATDRDLESLTQYSMLQQAHDAECQQLQNRIEALLDENFLIKKQLSGAVESLDEDAERKMQDLSQSQLYITQELEYLHGMVESMQSTSSTPNELERLKQNIESMQNKIDSPDTFTQQKDSSLSDVRLERDQLKYSLENAKSENERLNADLTEIHSQVHDLEGLAVFNTELAHENERLREENSRLMSSGNTSPRDADQRAMAQLTTQLQQENNDLKSENRSLTSQISDIEASLREAIAHKEKERLQQGSPVDKENNALKTQVESLSKALEEQAADLQKAQSAHPELPPDIEELRSQIAHLKRTISQQDETIMELVQQSTRDAQLREDYEKLESQSELMQKKMTEFQELFTGQSEESSQIIRDLEQKIYGLQDENSNLRAKSPEQVQSFSDADKYSYDSQIADYRRANRNLEEEKQQLEAQVSQFELEMMKMKRDADKAIALKKEKDAIEEEKLALEIQVAQLATLTLAAETSSKKVGDLEKENDVLRQERDEISLEIQRIVEERDDLLRENSKVALERDEVLQAIPTLKENIEKLETQQLQGKTEESAMDKLQEEYNNLLQERNHLESKVHELESRPTITTSSTRASPELRAKVKDLEEQLEREQSATVMTILDGRTAEQTSTENSLKEQVLALTRENEQLKDKLNAGLQNGNTEDVVMLTSLSLQTSAPSHPPVDNHRLGQGLGSSLKRRSEEFHLKQLEEENERLKTEIDKLKMQSFSDTQAESMATQLLMVQEKLEMMERRHRDVVTTYRAHLLKAVRGHMDSEVQNALMNIIKIRQAPEVDV